VSRTPLTLNGGTVIVALHLPALPGAPQNTMGIEAILQFAVDNAQMFAARGVDALYLQDPGHGIGPTRTPPETLAALTIIARSVHAAVPIPVGLLSAGYDAEGPLIAASAAGVEFVRLKVYVGAMVKAEGVVQGCAHEALTTKRRLGIAHVRILADIYDRTGVPLAPATLEDAARWAVRLGDADALILTGRRIEESIGMLDRVKQSGVGAPLLSAGGATADNVAELLPHCDGIIVSTSLKTQPANQLRPWDPARIDAFIAAVKDARQKMPAG
jgi:uncharacterized protein